MNFFTCNVVHSNQWLCSVYSLWGFQVKIIHFVCLQRFQECMILCTMTKYIFIFHCMYIVLIILIMYFCLYFRNEKEGIPVDIIQLLDVCVEIPQQGIIRSLNVHVSGALLIWEYARQRLIQNKQLSEGNTLNTWTCNQFIIIQLLLFLKNVMKDIYRAFGYMYL